MVEKILMECADGILTVLIPALALLLVELLRRKLGVEKMRTIQEELHAKQELGIMAVRYAEQAYKDYQGPVKLAHASAWLEKQAKKRGLNVTAAEVEVLVESGLRLLKDEFSEAWIREVQETEEPDEPSS